MADTRFWDERRGRIRTRKGGWRIGGGIRVGPYSLLDDLVGKHTFFELLHLELRGTLPDPALARWIEACFQCMSFPDPRIWCNQIAALGGSARCTPVAAISLGVLASDSALYGPGTTHAACHFIATAKAALDGGEDLAAFIARHTSRSGRLRAPGYSRPIASGDDRVGAMHRFATGLGFTDGPWMATAWRLDAHLRGIGDNSLNMLGYIAAFWFDRGISAEDGYRMFSLSVNAGVHACYAEAADAPAGAFMPLQCSDIDYTGKPARALPPDVAP